MEESKKQKAEKVEEPSEEVGFLKKYFTFNLQWSWKGFFFSFAWLAVVLFAIDILSKWAVVTAAGGVQKDLVTVIPNFFNIIFTINPGSAFGLGADQVWARYVFIVISWVGSLGITYYWLRHIHKHDYIVNAIFAMCLAGALGNAIDRTFYWESTVGFSGVVDFFDFEFWGWHFATFNFADACLVIGVLLALVVMVVRMIKERKQKD